MESVVKCCYCFIKCIFELKLAALLLEHSCVNDVCYQSLLLLSYLIRNGSERVVTSAREHVYDLRQLEDYTCMDEFGRDQGVNGIFMLLF